ncbi:MULTISPECIES: TetR/AcrR family transcriptional regulator [Kocuria]|jgi:AcrR family transcriptional regulator|uniref:TetR/AcrR family transcriptional regulator n=1 Tax=Kocuria TaxID=57493 RepID=UPI0008A1D3BF|nr:MULTISPECIES: TetR/AcrR family transcriptional regulator [Kocuria]OFK07350.1 hypothetical protein HMPREF2833_10700 [Kocuria sp. HMSC066H03]PKZ37323.1 TetR/AcrR family transcriptional regulator [Kocuria rhizophila]
MNTTARPTRADARRNRAQILEAAQAVFTEQGASATTESVAARAGVAIGTVFRHFPKKSDLLSAVVMDLQDQLAVEADRLARDEDPSTALFTFCSLIMSGCAANRDVFQRLAETGVHVRVSDALTRMRAAIDDLLSKAHGEHAVRADLCSDELIALLAAVGQQAIADDWGERFRGRVLDILFSGLRPPEVCPKGP